MTGVYTMKKVVSLLLALAMCLSVTGFAWADDITTEAALKSAIESAENGDTITLAGNIELSEVLSINKKIVLDLAGHTIEQKATERNAVYLTSGADLTITSTGSTGVIIGTWHGISMDGNASDQKLYVNNVNVAGGASGIWNCGTVTIESGEITGTAYNGIYSTGTLFINGGTVRNLDAEEHCLMNDGGTATITDGKFIAAGKYGVFAVGTISGGDFTQAKVFNVKTVTGGTFGNIYVADGASVSNATINGEVTWAKAHPKATEPTFANIAFGENATVGESDYVIAGNTIVRKAACVLNVSSEDAAKGPIKVTWKLNGTGVAYNISAVENGSMVTGNTLSLEATAIPETNYLFDGWYLNGNKLTAGVTEDGKLTVETVVAGDLTYVARFAADPVIAKAEAFIQNYDNTNSFEINSTDDMNAFAYAVTNLGKTFEGKTVTLNTNLDFINKTYRVVGDETRPFKGTFDAQKSETENYTISNISKTTEGKFIGLFGNLNGAKIQNLTLKDSKFDNGGVGYAGGIAAEAKNSTITNCTVSNVTTSGWFSGAVIGHTYNGVTVDTVTVTGCAAEGSKGGAIAGYADDVTIKNVNVSDVVSGAALIGHANAGTKTIENANVDAPDAPLIGMTYSETEGSISITGADTSIKTKDVIPADSEAGAKTITVNDGTFNIDVTDYRADNKLVKVETVNGETQYTIVEDGADVPAGTYTTQPTDPKDDHVVRKDGENSFTVLPDNKGSVSEGTYVTEPTQVPDGYEVVKNDNNTWTVKKSAPRYYYTSSASSDNSTAKDDGKKAPRTFDPGVGIYALTAVLSVTGMALVGKRKD